MAVIITCTSCPPFRVRMESLFKVVVVRVMHFAAVTVEQGITTSKQGRIERQLRLQ